MGYLTSDGHFDTCIVIRSAFCTKWHSSCTGRLRRSIDSDPQMEADETRHKAAAVLKAIRQVNTQAK